MAQAFQANGIVKYEWKASITPIMKLLIENNINIIQMPCPESVFGGYNTGLSRTPKGYSYYNCKEFGDICEKLASQIFNMVKGILDNKYEIIAIMGIEMSPSCALNYQYTNKGMQNMKGIFMEKLVNKISKLQKNITFIGINRKYINKSLNKLKGLI
jgi:predicted secreted protein